jgi:hypothetical protein
MREMGSYKYTVSVPKTRTIGGEGDTTPPVESYDLGPKIRAAIACGVFVSLFVCAIWTPFTLSPDSWQLWAKGMVGIAILGILVACSLGCWWSYWAAYRPWHVDNKARRRLHEREDAQIKAQEEALRTARERIAEGDDTDGNPLTFTDEQRLDWVALRMLELVYMRGQAGAATRDAMTGAGFCSQPEWNLVNKGMKALRLRVKQSWAECSFQEAVALWRDNIRIEATPEDERYLQVLKQNGEWYALERIE